MANHKPVELRVALEDFRKKQAVDFECKLPIDGNSSVVVAKLGLEGLDQPAGEHKKVNVAQDGQAGLLRVAELAFDLTSKVAQPSRILGAFWEKVSSQSREGCQAVDVFEDLPIVSVGKEVVRI